MECKDALPLLHEYLDGGLQDHAAVVLNQHLLSCEACRKRLRQLEKTEALLQSWKPQQVPNGLTERIMNSLPQTKRNNAWYSWVRRHPAISAAAVFFLVMFSSFLSTWNENHELTVKGSDLQSVVIKDNTVYVPEGTTIAGDLTVENGKLQVNGDIKGNIIVIDGSVNLASTAHISGQIKQIDEAFSWIWYKMNQWLVQMSGTK